MKFKSPPMVTIVFAAILFACSSVANAQLVYHYDPATGNVAFDTANTRTGQLYLYSLTLLTNDIEFRVENHIPVGSVGATAETNRVSESTFTNPWEGLYTIGDILPAGLDESTWSGLFSSNEIYVDEIGGGTPPPIDFVYGAADGEFNNVDVIDPNDLDWAEAAQLVYRQQTGELVLVTSSGDAGGYISGFLIQSNGQLDANGFIPPFTNPVSTNDTDHVGFFADYMEPGEFNLGGLLQPGLTEAEYFAAISSADFYGQLGFGSTPLNLETDGFPMALVFQAVPEPTHSALLLLIAGTLLFTNRRR